LANLFLTSFKWNLSFTCFHSSRPLAQTRHLKSMGAGFYHLKDRFKGLRFKQFSDVDTGNRTRHEIGTKSHYQVF
ncbi:MAG TPA: hypothetical protein VHT73_17090, partial [Thermodesulfobacteriota bacterium]|nr:hypothetical protein [Thermodesulfobacteriota bacterium]